MELHDTEQSGEVRLTYKTLIDVLNFVPLLVKNFKILFHDLRNVLLYNNRMEISKRSHNPYPRFKFLL